jgi:hypothetical protein
MSRQDDQGDEDRLDQQDDHGDEDRLDQQDDHGDEDRPDQQDDHGDEDRPGGVVVTGTVVAGHGVASGRSPDSPFPAGTIALQVPVFAGLGLDLGALHPATVNVDIAPARYTIRRPAHTYANVHWTDVHGPETFSFLRCVLTRSGDPAMHRGWVYYPHPDTKPMHEQPRTVLELLMPHLPGLSYGDVVALHLDPAEISVSDTG